MRRKEEKDENPFYDSINWSAGHRLPPGSQSWQSGSLVQARRRFFGGRAAFRPFDRGSCSLLLPGPCLRGAALSCL